jgi:hypothetical protein
MSPRGGSKLVVFCHIPKTAGMAVYDVLKANLGVRFLASTTWGKRLPRTTRRDLAIELISYPRVAALAGHGLRPFIDYAEYEERFQWFTYLRDPIQRVISHYVYDRETKKTALAFEDWLTNDMSNYQVRWIAGKEDLAFAKQFLTHRCALVGLQERFNASLILMNRYLFDERLYISDARRVNVTQSTDEKRRLVENLSKYRDIIEETNALDLALYRFAIDEIWPRQVTSFGEDELNRRVQAEFGEQRAQGFGRNSRLVHDLHRNLTYKPTVFLAKALGARV